MVRTVGYGGKERKDVVGLYGMIPHKSKVKREPSALVKNVVNTKVLNELEQNSYNIMFNKIVEDTGIHKPVDLMMLDVACFDYIRIKRLQKIIGDSSDVYVGTDRNGKTYEKVREVSYLINQINASLRASMRELMLSRKSRTSQEIGKNDQDFANWLKDNTLDVEPIEEVKENGNNTKSKDNVKEE